MKKIPFTKMHGIGNDFVLLNRKDIEERSVNLDKDFIQRICNRNFGIGSDGLLVLDSSEIADFKYTMFNPDGSTAEMCGNGIRCFMMYLHEQGITEKNKVSVETGAGILYLELEGNDVIVDMGTPKFDGKSIGIAEGAKVNGSVISCEREFSYYSVSMGNPHAVIFLEESVKDFELNKYGAEIEKNTEIFKNKINVEFIEVISPTEINFRVFERGAGETLACGTGACASVVAGIQQGKIEPNKEITVHLAGGDLFIKWSGNMYDSVIMKGGAENSFSGEYLI